MSKKQLALLSLSLLTLAACSAPADVSDETVLDEELPPSEEVFLDDLILEEETPIVGEEVLVIDEEAAVEAEVEAEIVE